MEMRREKKQQFRPGGRNGGVVSRQWLHCNNRHTKQSAWWVPLILQEDPHCPLWPGVTCASAPKVLYCKLYLPHYKLKKKEKKKRTGSFILNWYWYNATSARLVLIQQSAKRTTLKSERPDCSLQVKKKHQQHKVQTNIYSYDLKKNFTHIWFYQKMQ